MFFLSIMFIRKHDERCVFFWFIVRFEIFRVVLWPVRVVGIVSVLDNLCSCAPRFLTHPLIITLSSRVISWFVFFPFRITLTDALAPIVWVLAT